MKSLITAAVATAVLSIHPLMALAQTGQKLNVPPPMTNVLSLEAYLEQVRQSNPQARALLETVSQTELRLDEAEVSLSSELYGKYNILDDRNEPTVIPQPKHIEATAWRAGVRDRNQFGLSTDIYYDSNHTTMPGVTSSGFMMPEYYDTRFGIDISQSLWRNGFGAVTKAELDSQRAKSRAANLKAKYELKDLLTKAENTYFMLGSFNEIVKLQEENVERAKKLSDWMRKREGLRLVDDVDFLQTQASLQTRELELLESRDELAALKRHFNTLRGKDSDDVGLLSPLPAGELLLKASKDSNKQMTREDFRALFEEAVINSQMAKGARSAIAPQLDLVAGISANGLSAESAGSSSEESFNLENPTISVGLVFSIPLDYSLISNMRRSYKAQQRAAESQKEYVLFAEKRAWDDLQKKKLETQQRFEKAVALEDIQTKLVKRERARLLNGRTTTFQANTFEQNLALAQIQRVRMQLALLQVHNLLKQFEAKL